MSEPNIINELQKQQHEKWGMPSEMAAFNELDVDNNRFANDPKFTQHLTKEYWEEELSKLGQETSQIFSHVTYIPGVGQWEKLRALGDVSVKMQEAAKQGNYEEATRLRAEFLKLRGGINRITNEEEE